MVVLHETIGRKQNIKEVIAPDVGAATLEAAGVRLPIPQELLAVDGKSYGELGPHEWRLIASYQEPEVYRYAPNIMPFSEEALGDDF